MHPVFKVVYNHPLISEKDLMDIAAQHAELTIGSNTLFFKEKKIADEYYLLEKGIVRAYAYDYDGNEITTEFFTEKDLVIVPTSLFQRAPAQENLQTVTDCVMWKIGFNDFQQLFHAIPGFREWGRLWFTTQLFSVKQRTLDMVRETATSRYIKLLKDKPEIVQYAPLKQIASYLGVTDTSLSRIRKEITI